MPKNTQIKSILIIGSGPIIIGQACEFDYSGTQASRSLREEGIEVTLINSNPATIMTDKVTADHIYLLPLTVESLRQILTERHIDAVLPTMGGQTALNLAIEADQQGLWEEFDVEMIGVDVNAIELTENREKFRQHMIKLGMGVAPSYIANSFLEGKEAAQKIGFPLVIRPSYTLGGNGRLGQDSSATLGDQAGEMAAGLAATMPEAEKSAKDAEVAAWAAKTPDPAANELAPTN